MVKKILLGVLVWGIGVLTSWGTALLVWGPEYAGGVDFSEYALIGVVGVILIGTLYLIDKWMTKKGLA